MDINKIAMSLGKIATVEKVSEGEYEIKTGALIDANNPIKMYLTLRNGEVVFHDKKATLLYMNDIYELKSTDVKSCIGAVVKLYNFAIISGELVAPVKSESKLFEIFYNYIICVGQLAHMLVFFDQP